MATGTRTHGILTANLRSDDQASELTDSAAAMAAWMRERLLTDGHGVTVTSVDRTRETAEIEIDTAAAASSDYRDQLAIAASYLTGSLVVIDESGRATKHVVADGQVRDYAGRFVFADERLVTENEISTVLGTAVDDIDDAAGLDETGTVDALNLLVNTALHRLFTDPDAELADVVYANYDEPFEDDDDVDNEGIDLDEDTIKQRGLEVVLDWINS